MIPREAEFAEQGKVWGVMRKAPKYGKLHPIDEDINRIIAMVRSKVEDPFRVIKRQFGYLKTSYCGLARNRAQLFKLFALGNLFIVRRRLMALGRVCPKACFRACPGSGRRLFWPPVPPKWPCPSLSQKSRQRRMLRSDVPPVWRWEA